MVQRIEKSRVPLGWIFALLSCSGGALGISISIGLYTGRLEGRVGLAISKAESAQKNIEENSELQQCIDRRLSRIEGALGLRPEPFKRKIKKGE